MGLSSVTDLPLRDVLIGGGGNDVLIANGRGAVLYAGNNTELANLKANNPNALAPGMPTLIANALDATFFVASCAQVRAAQILLVPSAGTRIALAVQNGQVTNPAIMELPL